MGWTAQYERIEKKMERMNYLQYYAVSHFRQRAARARCTGS